MKYLIEKIINSLNNYIQNDIELNNSIEEEVYWVTKDKRKINIKNMSINHLKNSIAMCNRNKWRLEAIPYLEQELKTRL